MNKGWEKYMTLAEELKIENLEYEIRMIMNRCIARQLLKEKDDA